jgi:hypothetical protein
VSFNLGSLGKKVFSGDGHGARRFLDLASVWSGGVVFTIASAGVITFDKRARWIRSPLFSPRLFAGIFLVGSALLCTNESRASLQRGLASCLYLINTGDAIKKTRLCVLSEKR